jgi:hypothetical protein
MVKTKKSQKHSKKHNHKKISHLHKIYKTKRKTKDHDQIHLDIKVANAIPLLDQAIDIEQTGAAQNYCIHCALVSFTYILKMSFKILKVLSLFFKGDTLLMNML